MEKLLKLATPLLGVIFLVLLLVSARLMMANRFLLSDRPTAADSKSNQYTFFLPASGNPFFSGLKTGALQAANAMDCAVIFHTLEPDDLSFEMASYAGANGIVIFSYDNDRRTIANLEKILKRGIPVVQIENEIVSSPNTVLIGTNSYDSGKGIGKIALGAEKAELHVALIYSDKNPPLKADANLVEIGMKSILGRRLAQLYTKQTSFNPIDAEGVIYELLREHPAVDIVALTNANDTLVAIQAIIDLNLVGRVQIIGFGDDPTIKEYIKKGVVLGSIVRNPVEIGYRAIAALKEINTRGNTSAYVNTAINIMTADGGTAPQEGQSP